MQNLVSNFTPVFYCSFETMHLKTVLKIRVAILNTLICLCWYVIIICIHARVQYLIYSVLYTILCFSIDVKVDLYIDNFEADTALNGSE